MSAQNFLSRTPRRERLLASSLSEVTKNMDMQEVKELVAQGMVLHHRVEDMGDLREDMEDNLEQDIPHLLELMVLLQEDIQVHKVVDLVDIQEGHLEVDMEDIQEVHL